MTEGNSGVLMTLHTVPCQSERLTHFLRWLVPIPGAVPILQQKWEITKWALGIGGPQEITEEWRNVPTVIQES